MSCDFYRLLLSLDLYGMYANVKEELQFYNALKQKIPAGNLCEY